jgi:hypothetical protein
MKLPVLLLAGSLAANAALLGLAFTRPALTPPAVRAFFAGGDRPATPPTAAAPRPKREAGAVKLWSTLSTDDLPTLVTRLRAAGFPPGVIRAMVSAEISARYDARMRAIFEPDGSQPFWKQSSSIMGSDSKRMEDYARLQRERTKLMRDLFSDDFFGGEEGTAAQRRQFGNLSRSKVDLVQRIEDDYGEMLSTVRAAMQGITLPEDREKMALLNREKRADLAAVLSPVELADYELRSSPITRLLTNRLGAFTPTEGEFRALYDMQATLNEKFPYAMGGGSDFQARQETMRALSEDLKAKLGPARYDEFTREINSEYQSLNRLAQRDNLPAGAPQRAFSLRDSVGRESMQILENAGLSNDQKRAALLALGQQTRAQLVGLLGPTAGPAYVKLVENQWLGQLERGSAFSLGTAAGGMTIGSDNIMVSLPGSMPSYRRVPPGNMQIPPRPSPPSP